MTPTDLGSSTTHDVLATADGTLRTSLVTTAAALRELRPALDALAQAAGAPASVSWAAAGIWLGAHPEESAHVVLVHRGPTLVGAALLSSRRERTWTRLAKAGVPGEPFQLLHADAEAADALVRAVTRTLPRHSYRLVVEDLPDPDPVVEQLATALPGAQRHPGDAAPVLDVTSPPPGEARPTLGRNTRQAVAKATNRARKEGHDLRCRWTAEPDEVVEALPALVELHVARNADRGRAALLLDPVELSVFEETLVAHARSGRVRLLLTTIDDDLAAFAISFTSPRRWWVWSNYANPAWLRYSPGTVSNAEVVRAASADPEVDDLDWGQGVQRYKLSGEVRLEHRQRVEAGSPGVALLLRTEQAARRFRRGVARRVVRRLRGR